MNIGRKIKSVRKRLKISRLHLASLTGLSYSTISSYENGTRKPPRNFLQMLEEIERVAGHPAGAASVSERTDLPSLRSRLLALEARVGAFENRFAALETRSAQLEARAETGLAPSAEAAGVVVRGAIQVGGQDQSAPEKQPDEKTAEKKARQQEH
jgi:transcriptional regulator with XRE-family HTH domain